MQQDSIEDLNDAILNISQVSFIFAIFIDLGFNVAFNTVEVM